jgi:hypothetical protein
MSARTKMRIRLTIFAAVLVSLTTYSSAHAATASSSVPVSIQFQSSPRTYDWGQTVSYQLALRSTSRRAVSVRLVFMPYVELVPGQNGFNGKGGQAIYSHNYLLRPSSTLSVPFRVFTPEVPPQSLKLYWCLEINLEAAGIGPQRVTTCAVPAVS